MKYLTFLTLLSVMIMSHCQTGIKNQVAYDNIMQQITDAKTKIEKMIGTREKVAYVCIWDFDGTIIQGDCSEGFWNHDKQVYKGLAQLAIEKGLSRVYKKNQFNDFWKEYQRLDREKGHRYSYPYLPSILYGNKESELREMSREYFNSSLKKYYFRFSTGMIDHMKKIGVENHIISASADFFVKGASESLGIPEDHINGLRLRVDNGIVTNKVIKPISYADGKIKILKEVILKVQKRKNVDRVVVLAGFGNSFSTDGPFLAWIRQKKREFAKPVTVMINGGRVPDKYQGLFMAIDLSDTHI